MSKPKKWVLLAMVLFGAVMGVLPYALHYLTGFQIDPNFTVYPWNFSPLTALCLFAAFYVKDWRLAVLVPLAIRGATDLGIWLFTGKLEFALYGNQPIIYGSLFLYIGLGTLLRREHSPLFVGRGAALRDSALHVGTAGLLAETIFFLVSNFGSWLQYPTYPQTPMGLLQCYAAGLPFFGRSLLSTFAFSGILFGGYAWLHNRALADERQLAAERVD
ncbi:MAG: DUF6580 family putative transport protein [Planctomycetaceae bacterium]